MANFFSKAASGTDPMLTSKHLLLKRARYSLASIGTEVNKRLAIDSAGEILGPVVERVCTLAGEVVGPTWRMLQEGAEPVVSTAQTAFKHLETPTIAFAAGGIAGIAMYKAVTYMYNRRAYAISHIEPSDKPSDADSPVVELEQGASSDQEQHVVEHNQSSAQEHPENDAAHSNTPEQIPHEHFESDTSLPNPEQSVAQDHAIDIQHVENQEGMIHDHHTNDDTLRTDLNSNQIQQEAITADDETHDLGNDDGDISGVDAQNVSDDEEDDTEISILTTSSASPRAEARTSISPRQDKAATPKKLRTQSIDDHSDTRDPPKKAPRSSRSQTGRSKWTPDEDEALKSIAIEHGANRWTRIAEKLNACNLGPQRKRKQCYSRWMDHLDPTLNKGNLTEEEKEVVFEEHARHGNQWRKIAEALERRSFVMIRNYWNNEMRTCLRTIVKDVQQQYPSLPKALALEAVAGLSFAYKGVAQTHSLDLSSEFAMSQSAMRRKWMPVAIKQLEEAYSNRRWCSILPIEKAEFAARMKELHSRESAASLPSK